MKEAKQAILVYDGDCGFCSASAEWIAGKWKHPAPAEVVASQHLSESKMKSLGLTAADVKRAAWWVEHGRRSGGHLAIARALVAAGGLWGIIGWALLVPPVRWFAAVGYLIVARYRYRLPGGTPACRM